MAEPQDSPVAVPEIKTLTTGTGRPDLAFTLNYRHDDSIVREIKTTGFYDAHVFAQFDARPEYFHIRPGALCIDVGANLGVYSLYLARRVGPTGRIIAFEGKAETCELLRMNAAANDAANITVEHKILAGRGTPMKEVTIPDSGQSEFRVAADGLSADASAITLDDYAAEFDRLDFLKIDVNGPDFEILLGGSAVVSRFKPCILIEFVPKEITLEALGGCFRLMRELHYQPMFFRGHWISALEICTFPVLVGLYQAWRQHAPGAWMNLMLVPKSGPVPPNR